MKRATTYLLKLAIIIAWGGLYNPTEAQGCIPGTVSYWKLDEIGGVTIFLDAVGTEHGLCTNPDCPGPVSSGILNRARSFNGSSIIRIAHDPVFNWGINSSFSIELWVQTTEPGTGTKVFIGKNGTANWWLGYGDNHTAVLSVRDTTGFRTEIQGTTVINDGEWHHIVGVRDAAQNTLRIYTDGVNEGEVSTFISSSIANTNPIEIGRYGSGFYFTGLLDEIAVYDTLLSDTLIASHYNNALSGINYCGQLTGVEEEIISDNYYLDQNYPNPFNPSTKIKYSIPEASRVTLKIYDLLGNEVSTLINEEKPSGVYEVEYSPSVSLSSGVYFYKIQAGNFTDSRMMLLLK